MRPGEKISQTHALTRREFIAGVVLLGAAGTAPRLEAALPVGSIDHVNIRVPDVQRSADFYIQLNAPGDLSRVPGAGVGAVLVEPPGGIQRQPAFQATGITLLTVAVRQLEPSATYYRNLLGAQNERPQKGRFRVGEGEFVLGPASGGEYFRVGAAGFDPAAAVTKLKSLGVKADVTRDKSAVSFRDLDGIRVQVGGVFSGGRKSEFAKPYVTPRIPRDTRLERTQEVQTVLPLWGEE